MNLLNKLKLCWLRVRLHWINASIEECEYELANARQWRATVKQMIEVAEKEKPQ